MTILNVTDINSGEIISVDTTNPTGTIHVLDADTGNIISIDLASPTGVVTVVDADTGDFIDLDYSNLTGIVTIVDSNTGRFVDIDFDNPAGLFYTVDENTGDLVQIDLGTDSFFKSGNLVIPSLSGGDTTAPTVSIILSQYTFKIGETATVTFTFSEEVMNFTVADVTSPNGSLSSFTVTANPLVYTATFTPTNSVTDATNVITVGTSWTDLAGNSPASSTDSSNYTVDTAAPTVIISSTETSPSPALPVPIAFTLSEISTDFAVGDLTLNGCTVANFAGSGTAYTCQATPSTPNGTFTIDIAANVFHDAAGNGNTAATQFSFTSSAFQIADEFTTQRAAGAINGTNAEPTGGARTVTDTNSVMTIDNSSNLVFNGAPANANGIGWFATGITRSLGKTFIFSTTAGTTFGNGNEILGLVRAATFTDPFAHAWKPAVNNVNNVSSNNGSESINVLGNPATHPTYYAIVLRATGAKFLRKISTGNWVLEWAALTDNTATLYAILKFSTNSMSWSSGFVRVTTNAVSILPITSDSFNRGNGAIGTTDGAGSEETAPTIAWVDQAGTWTIASNLALASALAGSIAITTVETSNNNTMVGADLTRSAGVVGVSACYVDANNYIIAYHDGTNAKLDKVVGGSTTNVISGAASYGAGRRLVVKKNGTAFELYYNNARVGSGGTISDAGVISGTKHGLYTTDTGNTIDNFVCWATGTGEYDAAMNKYINP